MAACFSTPIQMPQPPASGRGRKSGGDALPVSVALAVVGNAPLANQRAPDPVHRGSEHGRQGR